MMMMRRPQLWHDMSYTAGDHLLSYLTLAQWQDANKINWNTLEEKQWRIFHRCLFHKHTLCDLLLFLNVVTWYYLPYTDFEKVIDKVSHRALIIYIRLDDSVVKWTQDFLFRRKQWVEVNDLYSHWFLVESGIPHGSLAPKGNILRAILISVAVLGFRAVDKTSYKINCYTCTLKHLPCLKTMLFN